MCCALSVLLQIPFFSPLCVQSLFANYSLLRALRTRFFLGPMCEQLQLLVQAFFPLSSCNSNTSLSEGLVGLSVIKSGSMVNLRALQPAKHFSAFSTQLLLAPCAHFSVRTVCNLVEHVSIHLLPTFNRCACYRPWLVPLWARLAKCVLQQVLNNS